MRCLRTEELDLAGFLADPRGEEFREFRAHYPACHDCSAEIRVWTELHLQLTEEAHPSPEDLLRLADDPAELSADERTRLGEHLAHCASCREEMRAVEEYRPDVAAASSGAEPLEEGERRPLPAAAFADIAQAPRPTPSGPVEHAGAEEPDGWIHRAGRVVWSPAFAYAAMLLLGLPLLFLRRDVVVEPVRTAMAPPEPALARRALDDGEASGAPARLEEASVLERPQTVGRPAVKRSMAIAADTAPPARALRAAPPVTGAPAMDAPRAPGAVRLSESGDAEGHADAPAEAEEPDELTMRRAGQNLVVAFSAPPSAHPLEVRVSAPGGRELSVRESAGTQRIELELPVPWLGPGPYRVEVRTAAGASMAQYVVRPP